MTSAATSTGILAASILGPAVRYLRMLSNCVAAAVLATAYVLALVVELNPALPLHPSRLIPLVATVGLFYGFHLTVIFYVLLVLRQLLARELFSPAWISVDVLAWLTAISASAGALLMWRNVAASSLVLDPATASTIVRSGYALAAAAACCFIVAVLHRGRPSGGCSTQARCAIWRRCSRHRRKRCGRRSRRESCRRRTASAPPATIKSPAATNRSSSFLASASRAVSCASDSSSSSRIRR